MRYYPVRLPDGSLVSLPSVTSVLSLTMPPDQRSRLVQAEVANPARAFQNRQAARSRGDFIHRYASTILAGGRMGHGKYRRHLKHLDPWLRRVSLLRALNTDCFVYRAPSPELKGYAGTYDLAYCDPSHGLTLVEIKSVAYAVHDAALESAKIQSAAYAIAADLHSDEAIATVEIVFVSPYRVTSTFFCGDELADYKARWEARLRQFGARLTEASD